MTTYEFWISSPKNISFRHKEIIDISDIGFDEEEWNELTEQEREYELDEYCKELAFNSYVNYGWSEKE